MKAILQTTKKVVLGKKGLKYEEGGEEIAGGGDWEATT